MLIHHNDIPGTIGAITTTLGQNNINIAKMSVSRTAQGQSALMALNIDQPAQKTVIDEINQLKNINNTTYMKIMEYK